MSAHSLPYSFRPTASDPPSPNLSESTRKPCASNDDNSPKKKLNKPPSNSSFHSYSSSSLESSSSSLDLPLSNSWKISSHSKQKKTADQGFSSPIGGLFPRRGQFAELQLDSQANCLRRFTNVRIRSASNAASNGLRNVSLNTERSKPEALSSSLNRPIKTVSVNSVFRRRF